MTDRTEYPILAAESRIEEVIERSRFITSLGPAATVAEARAFVDHAAARFPDATHNCYAWLVGAPGSTAQVGMSDAGEPHGTAGRPMLNVLIHSGVGDVVAVVTRYFGGVKLGRGGLVRAYGGCLKRALEAAGKVDRIRWRRLRLELEYAHLEPLKRLYPGLRVELLEEEFGARVVHVVRVPEGGLAAFSRAVGDATGGRVVVGE